MTTQVAVLVTGAKGSGKSTVMGAIATALRKHGVTIKGINETAHKMVLDLPEGLQEQIKSGIKERADATQMVIERMEESLKAARSHAAEAEQRARESINARDTAVAQFADLKRRLHAAEIQVARLGGYIEHVQESEEAARPSALRSESYPVPPPTAMRHTRYDPTLVGQSADGAFTSHRGNETARPPHWTGYGER